MKDLRQSLNYSDFLKTQGWQIIKWEMSGPVLGFLKKIPFTPFKVMKVQRFAKNLDLEKVLQVAKANKVFYLSLEPGNLNRKELLIFINKMKNKKFWKGKSPFLPTKTIIIDLEKGKKQLLEEMKWSGRSGIKKGGKNCRVKLINYQNKKMAENFYQEWKVNGRGNVLAEKYFSQLLQIFKNNCFLVSCFLGRQMVSGIVVLTTEDTAYYAYAFTSQKGRGVYAGYLAAWEAIRESKRRGKKIFDWEGIYDPRFKHLGKWQGFSEFKSKFGGEIKIFSEPYVKLVSPF